MDGAPRSDMVDELLDQAFRALADGDRAAANVLAGQVLAVDEGNADAEDLLAAPLDHGEIRRLTILFADLVDSTELSTRTEPEVYRRVIGRYRDQVRAMVERYGGHLAATRGDGLLAVFGHPQAHENDVQRGVQAGVEITRDVAALSEQVRLRFGLELQVRVGLHRGVVYLDLEQDDLYGLAANMAARVSGIAPPGVVVVSQAVEPLVRDLYELEPQPAKSVKGIADPVVTYRVVGERILPHRSSTGPLIGRERELEHLRACWARAAAGALSRAAIVFRGEAGIGKSRLSRAAVELVEHAGAAVLELAGSPFHTDIGLHPVRELLERRSGISRASSPAERLRLLQDEVQQRSLPVERIVPLLAPVLGIAPEVGYEAPQAEGRKLHEQIVAAVQDYLLACLDGPGLILVEDTHWFDPDTLELVDSLVSRQLHGVVIVVTGRDEAPLPKSTTAEIFELRPFNADETDELIRQLHPEMTSDGSAAVRSRCDGIPLYIEEVVAQLRDRPSDDSESSQVPDTLYEALFARLNTSRSAVRVVATAATIGSRADRRLLRSVVDLDEREFDDAIGELTAAGVLRPLGRTSWRFKHELLREVAAELSPPTLRRTLHARIADALVSGASGNPDWPVVAGHYERAGRHSEAASAHDEACADARRRGALAEARLHLTHAIEQIALADPGLARDRREIALRLRRGSLAYAAEGAASPNAAADFERCLELSGSDPGSDDLFATMIALYGYYAVRADLSRVDQLLTSVRSTLVGEREWLLPLNDAGFGMSAWSRGDFLGARDRLAGAATSFTRDATRLETAWFVPNEPTASVYTHLALARFMLGDLTGAQAEFARTVDLCGELGFPQGPFSLGYAQSLESLMWIEAGQLDRAANLAAQLSALGEQHGFDVWTLIGGAQQAFIAALAQAAAGADAAVLAPQIEMLCGIVGMWRALSMLALLTWYDAFISRLLLAAGRPAEARERVEIALQLGQETGMQFQDAELLRLRAHTHDDEAAQDADLSNALNVARRQHATIYELRIAEDMFRLRGEAARPTLLEALARFPAGSTWPPLAAARTLLEPRDL